MGRRRIERLGQGNSGDSGKHRAKLILIRQPRPSYHTNVAIFAANSCRHSESRSQRASDDLPKYGSDFDLAAELDHSVWRNTKELRRVLRDIAQQDEQPIPQAQKAKPRVAPQPTHEPTG